MTEAVGGDEPMNLEQASEFLRGRVSEEVVRQALASGAMRGRNIGGSVGWMTTKRAVLEWVAAGNATKGGRRGKG